MKESPKKILIVGDSRTFIMYISILLKRLGFVVLPAKNGIEALRLLTVDTPDLMLIDIMLSNKESTAAFAQLREDENAYSVPVIVVSTHMDNTLYEECKKLNCISYLTKPIKIAQFNDVLQKSISYPRNKKRKFLRVEINNKATLTYNNVSEELNAVNLSEGGVFLRQADPISTGTEVKVTLPLKDKKSITLKGTVVHKKDIYGEEFTIGPGIGIQFKDLTERDSEIIKNHIIEQLGGEIL